ncbi:MAG: hypothetical protein GW760_07285 [Legionella sp.]|nr:hypothetical protein [Legionella sp.]
MYTNARSNFNVEFFDTSTSIEWGGVGITTNAHSNADEAANTTTIVGNRNA